MTATPGDACNSVPAWSVLLEPQFLQSWSWRGHKLVHRDCPPVNPASPPRSPIRRLLVRHVYATQNSSPSVRRVLARLLSSIPPDDWGLNIGAGGTRLHPSILNLDIYDASEIDIVAQGQTLPFADKSLALVLSQEVLEHLPDPAHTVAEAYRVLKPGGRFYCQIPFIIGYHPGPTDFWRFTREGIAQLFSSQAWDIEEIDISLGHGSGFYRIAVEYIAVNFSLLSPKLYLPAKAFAALLCVPLKWPDLLSHRSSQKHRIPGGYYCIARKR